MQDTQDSADWIAGYSFIGKLYALVDGERKPLRLTSMTDSIPLNFIDSHGFGWLQYGGDEATLRFIFSYEGQGPNRHHLRMSLLDDRAKALDISRNGYLGVYSGLEDRPYLKIEPLQWGENTLICRWRDKEGHQVKAQRDDISKIADAHYLVTGEGIEQQYLIERIL